MKLHLGGIENSAKTKNASIICESHKPEIFGVIGGIVIMLIGRHLYKDGAEGSMNAENEALAKIDAMDYDPKKDKFVAKVLK